MSKADLNYYLSDWDKYVRRRIFEEMREWIISRFPPQIFLDVFQNVIAVAAEGDDDAIGQQAVDGDVLGH